MTLTRTQIRRVIGARTGQPFFRRFGGGAGSASAGGSTTTLIDTALLKEEDDYWNGAFIYFPATDEVREISDFDQGTSTVTWLAPIASGTSQSDAYEIWDQFTPGEVHAAIDHALLEAWPYFFMYGNNETLVLEEDQGLVYTLPTDDTIRRLCYVYMKQYDSKTGSVTTLGTTTQIIDSAAAFVAADVGKSVSIYKDGDTANGDVRTISTRDSATQITVSSAFTEAVPEGAKYRVLDINYIYPAQVQWRDWKLDKLDFPTTLWIGNHPTGYEGHLLYLGYEYEYSALATEAATTTCPQEYLINAALAYLYLQKLATSGATEQPVWDAMHKTAVGATQLYVERHRFRHLPSTVTRFGSYAGALPPDYPFR
jgi:hypothetical protein